jgi:hypothetical protein
MKRLILLSICVIASITTAAAQQFSMSYYDGYSIGDDGYTVSTWTIVVATPTYANYQHTYQVSNYFGSSGQEYDQVTDQAVDLESNASLYIPDDSSEFTWTHGANVHCPIMGALMTFHWQPVIGRAWTFAQTVQDDGYGNCTVIPDCTNGGPPACPQINPQRWTVREGDGQYCHPYHMSIYLTWRFNSGSARQCFSTRLALPSGSPGPCTMSFH